MQALRAKLRQNHNVQESKIRRILAELEFAQRLGKLEGIKNWKELIAKAGEILEGAISSESSTSFNRAIGEVESILAPIGKSAKKYTIHCVGHAHIDMNWLWSWPETVATTNDTIITVLRLMEEFPDFCFTQSQISVYEIIREHNPKLFEQIKQRIVEGRWEIAAVQWVEGDKNLVSGESIARHLLYARRYIKKYFDLEPEDVSVDWEPDTFGHAHSIPTILSRCGVRRYYLCRAGQSEKPPLFWWIGPDGSRILVNAEQTWYNDTLGCHNVQGLLTFVEKTGLKDWMCVYGVGDHGGGPTRRDLHMCLEMNTWPIFPNFKFTTANQYFKLIEKHSDKLPIWKGELNFEFPGCYTSQSRIKKNNRLAEHNCERAETFAVLAWRTMGMEYPAEKLRSSWIDTLFGHFHDILSGSGVAATRDYHCGLFQKITAGTGMIVANSLRSLASLIDTSYDCKTETELSRQITEDIAMGAGAGRGTEKGEVSSVSIADGQFRAYVIFNPTAWHRDEIVRLSIWDIERDRLSEASFSAIMPNGKEIPVQVVNQGNYWQHKFIDVAVPVSVPAMGYVAIIIKCKDIIPFVSRHYKQLTKVVECAVRNHAVWNPSFRGGILQGKLALENEHIYVEFDGKTAGIIKLICKATGRNLVLSEEPASLLEYILEQPGKAIELSEGLDLPLTGMSSWVIRPTKERVCSLAIQYFEPRMDGPHKASFEAIAKINESTIKVIYTLNAGEKKLDIDISLDWLERGGIEKGTPTLRMLFPFNLEKAKGRYEIPFGYIERAMNGDQEVPSQRWVDVSGKSADSDAFAGCALLNDCKYGYSLDGSTLRATLIRSSYDPDPLPELGRHEMRFALVPHDGKLSAAELIRMGAAFNQPLKVISTDIHRGRLPSVSRNVISCESDSVIVTNIKKAEDEDAVIVRLHNTAGRTIVARVRINFTIIGNVTDVVEVDLNERELTDSTARKIKDGFSVHVLGHGISSVMIRLE